MRDSELVRRNDSPNVRRSDKPGSMNAFSNLKLPPQIESTDYAYTLTELLSDRYLVNILLSSNIFIFGKVGFLDLVIEALRSLYKKKGKKVLETVRTQVEITALTTENLAVPFILVPAAKNKEGVSEIVASAFSIKRPIWLGALPSQIEKQILLSFDCFFISPGPKFEISYLCDLLGLKNEHREAISDSGISILTIDHNFPKLTKGKPDNPGRVFYIQDLK